MDEIVTQNNELRGFTKSFKRFGKEKKEEDPKIKELLLFQKANKIIIGTKKAQKLFKNNLVEKVYLSQNCLDLTKKLINHYSKLTKVEIVDLEVDSKELGIKLQKPFLVNVVCIIKKMEDKK